MADGDIFNVITYGRRTMPPGAQSPGRPLGDIAYVRVLQAPRTEPSMTFQPN